MESDAVKRGVGRRRYQEAVKANPVNILTTEMVR